MNEKLKDITVLENEKVKDVLEKINKNGFNGVFVLDKKKINWSNNRSDIRKNLLKNKLDINKKAISIVQKNF